jgi:PleD family two-component response regulator
MNISDQHHPEFTVVAKRRPASASPSYSARRAASARSGLQVTAKEFGPEDLGHSLQRSSAVPTVKDILVVDPNIGYLSDAERVLRLLGEVEVCADFTSARSRLVNRPPDLLITNLRLHEYNGLHLVHLATPKTRCVVYSNFDDPVLAREVQEAGAFYERPVRLARALSGYVNGVLPTHDRRSASYVDRRRLPRGGRRSADF